MSSSGAHSFGLAEGSAAAGGEEDHLLLHLHRQHHRKLEKYHVPQHSRREKLPFSPEGFTPPARPVSLAQQHHPAAATPSSPWPFYNNSSCHAPSAASAAAMPDATAQFMNHTINLAASSSERQTLQQHSFSLSLSSPTPSSVTPPRHHQLRQQYGVRPAHPLGPFTGYAAVLNRSRFLEPAQKLLEEVCGDASQGGLSRRADAADCDMNFDADLMDGSSPDRLIPRAGQKQCWRSKKLVSIVEEVYKRYKQYYQQVHDVITSFECVAGLGTAAPYVFMVLKVISNNFGSLKNMILDQLSHMNMVPEKCRDGELDISGFKIVNGSSCLGRLVNCNRSFNQPQLWRPQRGLPEPAVSVLRTWLFEHFLHPYPTDSDKQMLAKQTGLARNQVSNWFINARVRLWKPMVEEVHSLESQQKHKSRGPVKHCNTDDQSQLHLIKVARTDKNSDTTNNSIQQEVVLMPNCMPEHVNLPNDDRSDDHDVGVGTSTGTATESNDVSLTLGLHSDVVHFAEQLPVNVTYECLNSYPSNVYAEQGRSFRKNVSSHLFHDLVG